MGVVKSKIRLLGIAHVDLELAKGEVTRELFFQFVFLLLCQALEKLQLFRNTLQTEVIGKFFVHFLHLFRFPDFLQLLFMTDDPNLSLILKLWVQIDEFMNYFILF